METKLGTKLEHAGSLVRMARWTSFSCAHLYSQPRFSDEENRAIFGRCYTPRGHGHNYVLEAHLEGHIDPRTGLLVNLLDVDRILKIVVDPLDHQHLNFDVPYFKDRIPTTEILAQYCFRELRSRLTTAFPGIELALLKVRLFETDDLYAEYSE